MDLNVVAIQGRLTADPELRMTQSQIAVTSFTIANDVDKDNVIFIPVVAWRGTAEFVTKFFKKGSQILVQGKLTQRKWTTKDGQERTSTEIIADKISFCGFSEPREPKAEPSYTGVSAQFEDLDDDSDLPF